MAGLRPRLDLRRVPAVEPPSQSRGSDWAGRIARLNDLHRAMTILLREPSRRPILLLRSRSQRRHEVGDIEPEGAHARRIAAMTGLAVLVLGGLSGVATADSPIVGASGNQCLAQWISSGDKFKILDNDLFDSDWCYVDYSWESDHTPRSRVSRPQDVGGWGTYPVAVEPGSTKVYWHVCKERQNDSDICASWRSDTV